RVPAAGPRGPAAAHGSPGRATPAGATSSIMSRRVVIVGAGMGGLAAALRLARHGFAVSVLEARDGPGGLAAGFEQDGLAFDAGPYVLLDRPGLDWAFRSV